VIVSFVDIGRIVDHHCLEVIVRFVGELLTITAVLVNNSPISTKRTITSKQ
jgi:hypothetical protein